MKVIDMNNLLLGRAGTYAAKAALEGEQVVLVNCEKAVISGRKQYIIAEFKRMYHMGTPVKGPYYPRVADRMVRRKIRGMLPMTTVRGRDAYKRIMCYIGMPQEFASKKAISISDASADKLPLPKRVTIQEIIRVIK